MLSKEEHAKAVGQRIVAARKRKGMSQVKLSRILAERYGREPESVRRSLVNNETGKNIPRLPFLQAIAEITEQPLEFFAVDEENGDGPSATPFQDVA